MALGPSSRTSLLGLWNAYCHIEPLADAGIRAKHPVLLGTDRRWVTSYCGAMNVLIFRGEATFAPARAKRASTDHSSGSAFVRQPQRRCRSFIRGKASNLSPTARS